MIDDDPGADALLDDTTAMVLTDHCVEALDRATDDPVLVGRPYRDLGAVLARRRPPDQVARVVRFAAGSQHAAVRSVVLDVLLALVEGSASTGGAGAAEDLVVDLATDEDAALAALAIHATCGMRDPVGTGPGVQPCGPGARPGRRRAHGQRTGGSSPPTACTSTAATVRTRSTAVLRQFIGEVQRRHVTRLRGQLQFITEVTVTNYVNHCDEPGVVEMTNDRLRQLLVDELHVDGPLGRAFERLVAPLTAHRLSDRVLSLLNSDRFVGESIPNVDRAHRVTGRARSLGSAGPPPRRPGRAAPG